MDFLEKQTRFSQIEFYISSFSVKKTLTTWTTAEQCRHVCVNSWVLLPRKFPQFLFAPTKLKAGFGQNTWRMISTDESTTDSRNNLFDLSHYFFVTKASHPTCRRYLTRKFRRRRQANRVSNIESKRGRTEKLAEERNRRNSFCQIPKLDTHRMENVERKCSGVFNTFYESFFNWKN